MEIPQFKILQELGKGGMATVYLAIQTSLDRKVALKVMAPMLVADVDFRKRFLTEGKLIARLGHHNIITVHDIGAHGSHYYMALEYAGAGNLSERIQRGMGLEQTLSIMKQLARALYYAHEEGIVHRDVKSANILFRDDSTPLLTDFGVAKAVTSSTQLTRAGVTVGTPRYMSPEQAKGEPVTAQSDLYGLGVIFYEMLMGYCPYEPGPDDTPFSILLKHINEPIPVLPDELAVWQPVLNRLMAKSPADRFENAMEVLRELQEMEQKGAVGRENGVDSAGGITAEDKTQAFAIPRARPRKPEPSTRTSKAVGADRRTVKPERRNRRRDGWLVAGLVALAVAAVAFYVKPWQSYLKPPELHPVEVRQPGSLRKLDQRRAALAALAGSYRKILEVDEKNAKATEGLQQVAGKYAELALAYRAGLDQEGAMQVVETGLALAPGHIELLALKSASSSGVFEGKTAAEWLKIGERHFAAARYVVPQRDNAVAAYRNVLFLQPKQAIALDRLNQMASYFARQARRQLQSDERRQAADNVELGLAIWPRHEDLLALREKLANP